MGMLLIARIPHIICRMEQTLHVFVVVVYPIVPNRCAVAQQYLPFSGPNLYI